MPSPQQEQGQGGLTGFSQERTSLQGSSIHKVNIKSPPSALLLVLDKRLSGKQEELGFNSEMYSRKWN